MSDDATWKASAARDLLDNRLLNEVLAAIERDTIEEMLRYGPDQDAERRFASDRVKIAREIKQRLERYVFAKEQQDKKANSPRTVA